MLFGLALSIETDDSCGMVYFVHFAKCGGSSLNDWIRDSLGLTKHEVIDYDYFSQRFSDDKTHHITDNNEFKTYSTDPDVYFNWRKQVSKIEDWVENFDPTVKPWKLIHQHSFTPGLKYSMQNITRWRQKIESAKLGNKNCKFILFGLIRDPVKRLVSHLKYFLVKHSEVVDYVMGYGSNYLLRYLLYGECDYSFDPPHCAGSNIPKPTFSDVALAQGLTKQFDMFGTIENMEAVRKQFDRLIGHRSVEVTRVRAAAKKVNNYELSEQEMKMLKKFGADYDQVWYDAVINGKDISGITPRTL